MRVFSLARDIKLEFNWLEITPTLAVDIHLAEGVYLIAWIGFENQAAGILSFYVHINPAKSRLFLRHFYNFTGPNLKANKYDNHHRLSDEYHTDSG